MLQTVARIKPFSLAKIYGLLSATVTLLLGLILNAITVFWGQRALSLSWQSFTPDNQLMINTLTIKPVEILLLTCILTVIVLIVGMIYGLVLAWLYNFSAGLGGGLQLEMLSTPVRSVAATTTAVSEKPVSNPTTKANTVAPKKKVATKKKTAPKKK